MALQDCLACEIAEREFVFPSKHVKRVVEYDVSPPPALATRWIHGMGILDGSIVVSLDALGRAPNSSQHGVIGVLCNSKSPIRWAVEVDRVAKFEQAELLEDDARIDDYAEPWPPWLHPARTAAGREATWVDVLRLLRAVSASRPGGA